MQERLYQKRAIDAVIRSERAKCPSVCLVAPPGAGKTYMGLESSFGIAQLRGTGARAGAVVAVAHRIELVEQLRNDVRECNIPCGVIAPGHARTDHLVQCASVSTLLAMLRRGQRLPPASVVLWDECHHTVAEAFHEVYDEYRKAGAFFLGLTATPERSDGVSLYPTYRKLIIAAQKRQLIRDGTLVPTEVFSLKRPLRNAVADVPVNVWEKHARGTRTIVFARDLEHAMEITSEFMARGWPTGYIDGDMDPKVRSEILKRFRLGKILVLVNCRILTEGFNLPAIQTVVIATPVGHVGLYLQMTGRAGRADKGKKRALLLDLCGNHLEHGLPDDDRKFQLRGRPISTKDTGAVRRCSLCGGVRRGGRHCPRCGPAPRQRTRMGVDRERVVRIDPNALRRQRQEYFDELSDHAKLSGYDDEWIDRKFRSRFGISSAGLQRSRRS